MNPFNEKALQVDKTFSDWNSLYPKSYDKNEVSPYTKTRIILANGAEYESTWFLHQFFRHCNNNDIRRELALVRKVEQQQQKRLSCLKPLDESILEQTISYEQLAVDLTAIFAAKETNKYVKAALDFALLEDFDHLYRYADLLDMEHGVHAESLVGDYTEIMPGRPTIAEHRHPYDDVKRFTNFKTADLNTKLTTNIIVAAEQQTMNYYMNQCGFYTSDLGRRLYSEIAMIEEQHVTLYGSLLDTNCTWLENWLMHEYTECYLYYSLWQDETDKNVKKIFEQHFNDELAHLQLAADCLLRYEKRNWQEVLLDGNFPELLAFNGNNNKDYVRNVLKQVRLQGCMEDYAAVSNLPEDYQYFKFQKTVNKKTDDVASHATIEKYIDSFAGDYRYQIAPHPVKELRDRHIDNVEVARVPNA